MNVTSRLPSLDWSMLGSYSVEYNEAILTPRLSIK